MSDGGWVQGEWTGLLKGMYTLSTTCWRHIEDKRGQDGKR